MELQAFHGSWGTGINPPTATPRPKPWRPWSTCCHGVSAAVLFSLPLGRISRHTSRTRVRRTGVDGEKVSSGRRNLGASVVGASFVTPDYATAQPSPLTLGLGTCCLKGSESMQQVADGLRIGYRMIDTASHYENEADVANALQQAKVSRSDVFLITKIWFDDMGDRAAAAIKESLARLSTDYVDLLLMHFPGANDAVQSPGANRKRREETWRAMEEAKARGQAKDIGVANFTRRHLKELFEYCRTPPAVLQTEIHPYFQQSKLVEFSRQSNLQIQSFSPLAHGELNLLEDKLLKSIAAKHGKTPAQVVLRWLQQLSITPIVFSRARQRLEENWATVAADFTLSAGEMDRISFLDRDTEARVGFNPNLIA